MKERNRCQFSWKEGRRFSLKPRNSEPKGSWWHPEAKFRPVGHTAAVTRLTLDSTGQLLAEKDADGNLTTFQHDKDGNVVATVDPLGHVASATYNADNQLASSTNADGNKVLDTYDNAGRLTAKSYIAANGAQTDAESFTYDKDGMETAASNSYGGYAFTIDPAERMTRQTDPFGLTLNYTNDPNGKVTQVSDSAGGTLNSVYDADNRLTNRNFSETGTSLRIELTYNAQSQITDEKRYNASTGGTLVGETTQSFDPVGNVTEIKHKTGSGTVLEDFTYNYDPANRLTSETDTINGGTPTTTNYGYDGANQLTSAGSSNYNYDLTGNRNTGANQVGPDNQLVADANWTYKYDPAGKEIEKDGVAGGQYAGVVWKYGYDGADRLVSATETGATTNYTVTFAYDVFGNRVEKDVSQNGGQPTVTKFAYDTVDGNGNAWADLNSIYQVTTRRLYLDAVDAVFARIVGTPGTVEWYLSDHLGSVRGLMNNSGTLDDTITYDAYGNVTAESNSPNGDRYAYTGRERDVETGLQYNRARYYDPATGRWMSQDPLGFDAGDSNLYRYVNNGPTLADDPSGLEIRIYWTNNVTSNKYHVALVVFDPHQEAYERDKYGCQIPGRFVDQTAYIIEGRGPNPAPNVFQASATLNYPSLRAGADRYQGTVNRLRTFTYTGHYGITPASAAVALETTYRHKDPFTGKTYFQVKYTTKSIKVDTGDLTFQQELKAIKTVSAKLRQVPDYGGHGPNSNTYTSQLLKLASEIEPQIKFPTIIPNAPGWNFYGTYSYQKTPSDTNAFYDKWGAPIPENIKRHIDEENKDRARRWGIHRNDGPWNRR